MWKHKNKVFRVNRFLKKLSGSLVDVMVSHVENLMMVVIGNSNFTPIKDFGGERELKNVAFINWKPDEILNQWLEYCFSSLLWCAQIFNLCKGGITVGFFSGNPTIATIAKFSRNKMTDCIKNLLFSLTPSLAILMLFFTNLFPLTVTGPWAMNFRGSDAMKPCLNYWWTNLLYINNFYPPHMMDQVSVVFIFFWNRFDFMLLQFTWCEYSFCVLLLYLFLQQRQCNIHLRCMNVYSTEIFKIAYWELFFTCSLKTLQLHHLKKNKKNQIIMISFYFCQDILFRTLTCLKGNVCTTH